MTSIVDVRKGNRNRFAPPKREPRRSRSVDAIVAESVAARAGWFACDVSAITAARVVSPGAAIPRVRALSAPRVES